VHTNLNTSAGGLTADLVARAVIAAAGVYGDDPVRALSFDGKAGGPIRRSITSAASGLVRATGLKPERICGPLRVSLNTLRLARGQRKGRFTDAETAAMRAVEYAGWRPDARASVKAQVGSRRDDAPTGMQLDAVAVDGEVLEPIKATPVEAPKVVAEASPPAAPTPDRRALANRLAQMRRPTEAAPAVGPVYRKPDTRPPVAPPPRRAGEPQFRPTPKPSAHMPSRAGSTIDIRCAPVAAPPALSLGGRILALLAEGSANTQGMATCLDAKESAVCSELRVLQQEGRVTADPVPKEGLRAQRWRLAA
jgi:hypothetical protein